MKILPNSPAFGNEHPDEECARRIGQNACPSDNRKWTVRDTDIMNKKNADRSKTPPARKSAANNLAVRWGKAI